MTRAKLKKQGITLFRTGDQEYEVSKNGKVVGWLWREYEPWIGVAGKSPGYTWFFQSEGDDWRQWRHSSFKEALSKLPEYI